ASSYARKYALNGLFAIDDTKDADATNDHGKGGKDQPKKAEKVYVESNLPSWTERFDKLETAAERKQCYKDNEKTIFDELTKQEVANLQSYLVQLKEAEDKKGKLNINI
nr:ERF family protein [Spirochaetales bacterium]